MFIAATEVAAADRRRNDRLCMTVTVGNGDVGRITGAGMDWQRRILWRRPSVAARWATRSCEYCLGFLRFGSKLICSLFWMPCKVFLPRDGSAAARHPLASTVSTGKTNKQKKQN
jgi:hypothetical protein